MWLFWFLLVILQVLLVLAVETAMRLAGYGYDPRFFKRLNVGGENFFVQNEDFSFRFFPKAIARNPGPVRFPVHKAPDTFRIFVLGESAAMGDPAQSFAPDRYLEMLLRDKYPGRKFEIINLAFTAINSHVILPIARECAAHDGDLWIIYMGNNEMVGPFGAATVFGAQAPSLWQARFVIALQRWRLGQWLIAASRRTVTGGRESAAWGGMAMFLNNQTPPDSPLKETVYRNFGANLHEIVRAGVNSGAEVLLNTVAVNLQNCPPFASLTNSRLAATDQARLKALWSNAKQFQALGRYDEAAAAFASACRLDPTSAALQFHWGECMLAQSDRVAAREHFGLACDLDALPFRADSRITEIIRAEGDKTKDSHLVVLDAAAALAAGSRAGLCGDETFFEHVHFDFDGRYRLARAWAEQVELLLPRNTNGWLAQPGCERQLGLSDWNRSQVIHFMVERMQAPPLDSQGNNLRRRGALEERIRQLQAGMNAESVARTRQDFQKLLAERPADYFLHQNFAVFLEVAGDLGKATEEWRLFRDLLPHDSLGYFQVGRLLIAQQRYAESEVLLSTSLSIRPSRIEAWIELGNAQALQKKFPEALGSFSTALDRNPRDAQVLLRRGKVLARLERHAEALASYRTALQINPAEWLVHHELALELVAAQQDAAAGAAFAEAARLNPNSVLTRFDYATWLLNERRWAEAQSEFEVVLRLEPGNLRAHEHLNRLQARKR